MNNTRVIKMSKTRLRQRYKHTYFEVRRTADRADLGHAAAKKSRLVACG